MTHLHCTAGLHAACADAVTTPQQARRFPALVALRTFMGVLRESLAACRHYERLRTCGVPHDRAIRLSLGIGGERATTLPAAHPICFAGRA